MPRPQSTRKVLLSIVQPVGPVLPHSTVALKVALMDACPDADREIELLLQAFKSGAVRDMIRLRHCRSPVVLLPRLTRLLARDTGIGEPEADWAVKSWAMALGLIPLVNERLSHSDEPRRHAIQAHKTRLKGHAGLVTSIRFNRAGTHLASTSWDGTLRLWDMDHLGQHRILRPPLPGEHVLAKERLLGDVAIDTEGRLAAADSDGSIWLWRSADDGDPSALSGDLLSVGRVAFSRDNHLVASCRRTYSVCMWNADLGTHPVWTQEFQYMPECLAISPDGTLVAVATKGPDITLLNVLTGAAVAVLRGHTATVRGVAFSPDGARLVSASSDGTVALWDVVRGNQIRCVGLKPQPVKTADDIEDEPTFNPSCIAISPDGRLIAVGDFDEEIYVWRLNGLASTPFIHLHGHAGLVSSLAFSPDGTLLASSSWDGTICLWNIATMADPLYERTVRLVLQSQDASVASVQRSLRLGYTRAVQLLDAMADAGIVTHHLNQDGIREIHSKYRR